MACVHPSTPTASATASAPYCLTSPCHTPLPALPHLSAAQWSVPLYQKWLPWWEGQSSPARQVRCHRHRQHGQVCGRGDGAHEASHQWRDHCSHGWRASHNWSRHHVLATCPSLLFMRLCCRTYMYACLHTYNSPLTVLLQLSSKFSSPSSPRLWRSNTKMYAQMPTCACQGMGWLVCQPNRLSSPVFCFRAEPARKKCAGPLQGSGHCQRAQCGSQVTMVELWQRLLIVGASLSLHLDCWDIKDVCAQRPPSLLLCQVQLDAQLIHAAGVRFVWGMQWGGGAFWTPAAAAAAAAAAIRDAILPSMLPSALVCTPSLLRQPIFLYPSSSSQPAGPRTHLNTGMLTLMRKVLTEGRKAEPWMMPAQPAA